MQSKRYSAQTVNLTVGGMNWIRQTKRLAIYLRDGMACVWCGRAVENGITLTLDHLVTRSSGGGHHHSNLVTACAGCNADRGETPWKAFATYIYDGNLQIDFLRSASEIVAFILRTKKRPLAAFHVEAREMIDARGSCAKVVHARINNKRNIVNK